MGSSLLSRQRELFDEFEQFPGFGLVRYELFDYFEHLGQRGCNKGLTWDIPFFSGRED